MKPAMNPSLRLLGERADQRGGGVKSVQLRITNDGRGRVSDLIDTTEMYLKTVYELIEEGIPPMRARIAERLGHSGPTVSQTVARLERDGLMLVTTDRHLRLTAEGKARATKVMRKHRLAERLLTDVIGLEWPFVHEEACRWEHVISEHVEERLVELLGKPQLDPYGNPIPGLAGLGVEEPTPVDVIALATYVEEADDLDVFTVRLERIGEPLQVDTRMLEEFLAAGIAPPTPMIVRREGESLAVSADEAHGTVLVPLELARHLFIRRPTP